MLKREGRKKVLKLQVNVFRADDTGLLAVHSDPDVASQRLQNHLTLLHDWFEKWKIRVNPAKSAHVTFTTRHVTSPPVFCTRPRSQ